jgi:hypothetical protein
MMHDRSEDVPPPAPNVKAQLPAFLADQWKKIVARPTRLYVVPANIAIHLVWHPTRRNAQNLIGRLLRAIPQRIRPASSQVRARWFEEAVAQFHNNQPQQAWTTLRRVLRRTRTPIISFSQELASFKVLAATPTASSISHAPTNCDGKRQ